MLLRALFSSSHQATAGTHIQINLYQQIGQLLVAMARWYTNSRQYGLIHAGLHSAWSVLASGLLNPNTLLPTLTASFSAVPDNSNERPNTSKLPAQQPFQNDTAATVADATQQQGNAAVTPTTSSQGNDQQGDIAGRSNSSNMAFGTRQVKAALRGREVKHGIVHISNTYNNTILCLTDTQGIPKVVKSAGSVGFKNARKSQPVAVEKAAETLAQAALQLGYGSVVVKMKGVGPHKKLAAQTLHAAGLRITELQDITPVAYNGCRLPKRRRV